MKGEIRLGRRGSITSSFRTSFDQGYARYAYRVPGGNRAESQMAYEIVSVPMPRLDVMMIRDWCATVMSMPADFSSRKTA